MLGAIAAGCGGGKGGPDAAAPSYTFGGDRPATLQVPHDYDPGQAYPLLVILHGYSATGFLTQELLGFGNAVDQRQALMIAPDGTLDQDGKPFWNASDACCNKYGSPVDDVAYLGGLIEEIQAAYHVDAGRVFVIGHSNGGFMAFRLACERADLVTGIMSLAGAAAFADPAACVPSRPVSVLDVHGDADAEVLYDGGTGDGGATYPGAVDSVTRWASAAYDGCAGSLGAGDPLDLDAHTAGAETATGAFGGCPDGGGVELWTIQGGGHVPELREPEFADDVWSWLAAHARPT